MAMASQFPNVTSSSSFFWRCFVSLVEFSYWSKCYVSIITGSGVMIIFFYKGLTRNPEISNTPVWLFPKIWRLGRVRDTRFSTNVSNKMLKNPAKCNGYRSYHFLVIKGKPTVVQNYPHPPPTHTQRHQIRVNMITNRLLLSSISLLIIPEINTFNIHHLNKYLTLKLNSGNYCVYWCHYDHWYVQSR